MIGNVIDGALVPAASGAVTEVIDPCTGKPVDTTRSEEILAGIDQVRYFAGLARSLEGAAAAEYTTGHTSYVRREPVGVVGQVAPWNYPFLMAIWKIGPRQGSGLGLRRRDLSHYGFEDYTRIKHVMHAHS